MTSLRIALAVLALVVTSACAPHFEKVGDSPMIGRVVHDGTADGVPDVMVWLTYRVPGGVFSAPERRAFGPYYTDQDGFFRVPPHPFYMFQTLTIFDGSPVPMMIFIHPTEGAIIGPMGDRTRSSPIVRWRATWSDGRRASYGVIDLLPPAAQEIARRHARMAVRHESPMRSRR